MALPVTQIITPDDKSTTLSTKLDMIDIDPDKKAATALAANNTYKLRYIYKALNLFLMNVVTFVFHGAICCD